MSETPAFGSPEALAFIENARVERTFLAELWSDGLFFDVSPDKLEAAEATALSLRYHLKRREVERGHFKPWHGAQKEKSPEAWEGKEFRFHPAYWYVKALILEKKLKEMGVPLGDLPDEMYYPTHEWLLFKGEYGPWWARHLPEGMDYEFDEEGGRDE